MVRVTDITNGFMDIVKRYAFTKTDLASVTALGLKISREIYEKLQKINRGEISKERITQAITGVFDSNASGLKVKTFSPALKTVFYNEIATNIKRIVLPYFNVS